MKSMLGPPPRLPEDWAKRCAACTPLRKRNQFVVDFLGWFFRAKAGACVP